MEKEKVYVLVENSIFDCISTVTINLVTTNKEKAVEEWKKLLEKTTNEYAENYDLENITMDIDERNYRFDFYENGRCEELNTMGWIETKEMEV